jgi:hypothetical protein
MFCFCSHTKFRLTQGRNQVAVCALARDNSRALTHATFKLAHYHERGDVDGCK